MNDTPPRIHAKMVELMKAKSPAERLKMGSSMFDMARTMVLASIKTEDPRERRRQLFLRFYGQDFSPAQRERWLELLD
jgi:hypothetical protein